jgi:hypothetical protein
LTGVLLAIAAIGVQAWAGALEPRCTEAAAATHLHGAWDEDRRVQVREEMLGVGVAYARDAWAHAETTLDAYASEWTQMHVEACEATNVRGQQSAAVMDLRMGCLHRAKVELAAVTNVLAHPEARTVQKAHELTGSLLYNRMSWIGIAILCVTVACSVYRFADRGMSKRERKLLMVAQSSPEASDGVQTIALPSPRHGSRALWTLLWMRVRFEARQVVLHPAFAIVMAWGLFTTSYVLSTRDSSGRLTTR